MNIEIIPGKLKGTIQSIQSKSAAHRLLICAALSGAADKIVLDRPSEDINATVSALQILQGGRIADCKESGTTLRLLFPVAAALGLRVEFTGQGRLPQRPMEPMLTLLREHGCTIKGDSLPLKMRGTLNSGAYQLPGNISSQYISGLLLALPLLDGESSILLTTPLESSGYVDMTLQAMRQFGVEAIPTSQGWSISGNQSYKAPPRIEIEGDWSNSAFWFVANALHSDINVVGLKENTCQKDSQIKDILETSLQSIDVKDIPDLVPALAIAACGREGSTTLKNCERLRLKESDRIQSVCSMIHSLGGRAEEKNNDIIIYGSGTLSGGTVDSANDHRIAMAAAIAATICSEPVVIEHAQAVNKSYPNFFKDYNSLGGRANVI